MIREGRAGLCRTGPPGRGTAPAPAGHRSPVPTVRRAERAAAQQWNLIGQVDR